MRRWACSLLVGLLAMLVLPRPGWADNGPHEGTFTKTTDACAQCHRAHRGQGPGLLAGDLVTTQQARVLIDTSQINLCFSCHGSAATGADTNVEDGIYMNRASGGQFGVPGAGLRGGGFVNALMDPDLTGTPTAAPVTSKHDVGVPGMIVWGLGSSGVGHVTSSQRATLQCSSCHNPHGFANADRYRILRDDLPCAGCHDIQQQKGRLSQASMPTDTTHQLAARLNTAIPDERPPYYTIRYTPDGYRDVSYLDERISEWCAGCHTRYLATGTDPSGDAVFAYRHRTTAQELTCLVCHVAHGTTATMGRFSGDVEWPDGTPGGGTTDSRLLHVSNRGVCYPCHPAP